MVEQKDLRYMEFVLVSLSSLLTVYVTLKNNPEVNPFTSKKDNTEVI